MTGAGPKPFEAARLAPAWRGTGGWIAWARVNLLATPLDAVLTLAVAVLIGWILVSVLPWALLHATWNGQSRADCSGDGACWAFVTSRFGQFVYGFYPPDQRWRVDAAMAAFVIGMVALLVRAIPGKRYTGLFMLFVYPLLALWLLKGGILGLPDVDTSRWGGLMLTLVLGVSGIVLSFPLGLMLALGRRSDLPVIQGLCIAFIELFRGLPLVTVLFMASVMLPFFLPVGMRVDGLALAVTGIALFQGAYLAEIVRGGLQAIPRGQYEAASALGFGYWRMTAFIILPQALRFVIPGLVNNSIALVKDTTLVMVVGLFELLSIVSAGASDPRWLGSATEGYVFVGLVFWLLCFGMSRYSQRLERSLARRQH